MNDYELAKKLAQEEEDHQLALKVAQMMKDEEYAKSLSKKPPTFIPGPPVYRPFDSLVQRVRDMVSNTNAQKIADKYGLTIDNVTWEDNARYANSSWGPCITDMTLQLQSPPTKLPVIRHPNFSDLTWDVPLDEIPLIVGNEVDKTGEIRYSVTLKEYLSNFKSFLTDPQAFKGPRDSLLKSGEKYAVMSAQSCFLPVDKDDGYSSKFNVGLYHYGDAPILAIVATSKGTSAQIVKPYQHGGQQLYFNLKGDKCSFMGQRLKDHRKETGSTATEKMTQEEKQQNMILVIQIPLVRHKPQVRRHHYKFAELDEGCCEVNYAQAAPPSISFSSSLEKKKANVEDAIIKIGSSEGKFVELERKKNVERDERWPIRITLQYYKCTDDGNIDEEVVKQISDQLAEAKKKAVYVGSSVVAPDSNRPTAYKIPVWWDNWWLTYRGRFPFITEDEAKAKVFVDGRFADKTMSEVNDKLIQILSNSGHKEPAWNLL